MAWWDVAEIAGDGALREAYLAMVDYAMKTQACFLREAADPYDAMDRLHAYAYFLEGLLPVIERPECRQAHADGLESMKRVIDEVEPLFVRADVYAQWLRAGLSGVGVAEKLAAFQAVSDDPRIDGGYYFGRRDGKISPQVNPVSTVFTLQALDGKIPCRKMLI
jgi:hypothetical protein